MREEFRAAAMGTSEAKGPDQRHAKGLMVGRRTYEALQDSSGIAQAEAALRVDLADLDAVYLTVCLDVLPAATAPGVSAPGVLGVPLAHVERLIDLVAGSGLLIAADIAELNLHHDRDAMTVRVAARLVAHIVRGAALASSRSKSSALARPAASGRPSTGIDTISA